MFEVLRAYRSLIVAGLLVAAVSAAPAAGSVPASTSVWKVETDSSVVYLIGSIHLLKESDFPLPPEMEEAFQDARTLVFEVNIDSAQTPRFQRFVLSKAVYEPPRTLQTELGDSLYQALGAELNGVGLDIAQVNQFEPWMVAEMFLVLKLQQMGFDASLGVDRHFYDEAKAEGKTVRALETPEFQIDLFDSMPQALQRDLIVQSLAQASDMEEMIDDIIADWRAGDLEGLESTVNKSLADYPELRDRLLSSRNRNWLKAIDGYLKSRGRYLLVVGVAHMSGEDGLVHLLREAGYSVEQL
jgi:uncharacterized protein YbaP (TraB family)